MKKLLQPPVMCLVLLFLSLVSLVIGVSSISIFDFGQLSPKQWHIIWSSRIPRTVSIVIAGASLSVSGLLMQQLSHNKFVSPSTTGIMDFAKLGVVMTILLFGESSLFVQLGMASGFAILGTLLFIGLLRYLPLKDDIFIPLVGLMLGQVISALTQFLGNHFQILQSLNSWLQGNFAMVTSHRYELLFLTIPCLILVYLYAYQFTLVGMGEDFSKNLGLNYQKMVNLGLILISVMTALVVIVVGSLPFLGLIIPNIVTKIKGDHLKGSLVMTSLLGAILVMFCDILGRLILFPYEVSIGLSMGIVGSFAFLFLLLREKGGFGHGN